MDLLGDRIGLPTSHLRLNCAHAIRAEEGKHLVAYLKLATELGLWREVQNMELPFFVSNNHRSRNTDRHGDDFSLNGRKGEGGSGQTDYGDGQKQETVQCAGYKPMHRDISFPHVGTISLRGRIMVASRDSRR
jgi:hypothetical protein